MSSEIYIPDGCWSLDKIVGDAQIRLGLQGFGGTGKSWSSLTFPNPIVCNLDRGLGAHIGRSDVIEIPFYQESFCKKLEPNYNLLLLKDVLLAWLYKEGPKLSRNQTLIIDSNTQIQNAYHAWFNDNRSLFLTDKGKEDGFAEYKIKIQYFTELLELLKTLPCHVIYLCHETEASIGKHAGKIRPLLSGQVGDSLMTYFTDFFRQLATDKPKDVNAITLEGLAMWGMKNKQEFQDMCSKYPRNTIYYWQTEGDSNFDGKCSSLVNFPRFIAADYTTFQKHRRQTTNNDNSNSNTNNRN